MRGLTGGQGKIQMSEGDKRVEVCLFVLPGPQLMIPIFFSSFITTPALKPP